MDGSPCLYLTDSDNQTRINFHKFNKFPQEYGRIPRCLFPIFLPREKDGGRTVSYRIGSGTSCADNPKKRLGLRASSFARTLDTYGTAKNEPYDKVWLSAYRVRERRHPMRGRILKKDAKTPPVFRTGGDAAA